MSCPHDGDKGTPLRRHTFDPTRERRLLGTCIEEPAAFRRVFALGVRPLHWFIPPQQHTFRLLLRLDHEGILSETEVFTKIMRCPDKLMYPSPADIESWMNDKELRVEASARALIEDWHRREALSECERYMAELGQGYRSVEAIHDEHMDRCLAMAERRGR